MLNWMALVFRFFERAEKLLFGAGVLVLAEAEEAAAGAFLPCRAEIGMSAGE